MANDKDTVTVPSVSTAELVSAATSLAARAKQRLLEGAAAEGATIAAHARALIAKVDSAADAELAKLEAICRASMPAAPAAAPDKAPAATAS